MGVISAKRKGAREGDTRGPFAHPVLSCAHYFQAPAMQTRGVFT